MYYADTYLEVASILPPTEGYVEPIPRSAQMLLAKEKAHFEVINDIAGTVTRFFRYLRDDPEACLKDDALWAYLGRPTEAEEISEVAARLKCAQVDALDPGLCVERYASNDTLFFFEDPPKDFISAQSRIKGYFAVLGLKVERMYHYRLASGKYLSVNF